MPSERSASTRGPIGRLRICASPSTTTAPSTNVSRRRKEAHRRAGIAEEQRLGRRIETTGAGDDEGGVVRFIDRDAHGAQGAGHQLGVEALQRAGQAAGALGQRREQQRPIGDRLGTGRRDAAVQRTRRRDDGQSLLVETECRCHEFSCPSHPEIAARTRLNHVAAAGDLPVLIRAAAYGPFQGLNAMGDE
jgi:hypothetical protein